MRRTGLLRVAIVALGLIALSPELASGHHTARAAAPSCPWMSTPLSPQQRAQELVGAMNIDQKIAMLSQSEPVWSHYGAAGYIPGQADLCIPDLVLNDAGQGVGDQEVNTTAFPAPIAQSSSWDPALQYQFGQALGWEAWHKGINVQLAPGVETDRVPMNGRNFEYMSEDPYLSGRGGVAEVQGIQSNPVIATVKHFVANSQETNRMTESSDLDERTLEEIYAPPYEATVRRGHAGAVMCSYNRINGVYSCEDPATLTRLLKQQFAFDGFVMSDWGGTHSTVAAANAGLDMEMALGPGQYFTAPLKTAVEDGQVPMSRLDDMVTRIVRTMFRVGVFDHPAAAEPAAAAADVRRPQDLALARTISEGGTVLLKNESNVLPLARHGVKIAVIGPGAGQIGAEQFYNGAGSGHIPELANKPDVVSPLQGIQQRAAGNGDTVLYADGSSGAVAAAEAKLADVAIVFAGAEDSEGTDRSTLDLSSGNCSLAGCSPQPVDQDSLIAQVAAANPHTVVVLNTGGPVVMPWSSQIQALFEAWYPGQQDGNAIAALLFGDVDPSARLPETFPRSQHDIPTQTAQQYPGVKDTQGIPQSTYSEGLLVGYRWYDAKHIAPLFPFGFGLDYTTFGYRKLKVTATRPAGGEDPTLLRARIELTNTGQRVGADVPQLYVADPAATGEPPRQLKGYQRVALDPGQSKRVSFAIDQRALSYWSTPANRWRVARGCYRVLIGRDEQDITQRATISVDGASCRGAVASIAVPSETRCNAASGRLSGRRLGAVALGDTRAGARRSFRRVSRRTRNGIDVFCVASGPGIHVGYPSRGLLRSLSTRDRRRVDGRVVLVLTANRHFSLHHVRAGERLAKARRSIELGPALTVGRNTWYLSSAGRGRGVLKVQRGRVAEIGIADPRLTAGRGLARRFLGTF